MFPLIFNSYNHFFELMKSIKNARLKPISNTPASLKSEEPESPTPFLMPPGSRYKPHRTNIPPNNQNQQLVDIFTSLLNTFKETKTEPITSFNDNVEPRDR